MTVPLDSEELRNSQLREEARWLFRAIFGDLPEAEVVEGYVRAHRFYCTNDKAVAFLQVIVQSRLDVEAIELVLRRRRTVLSRKCRMLVYLAEAKPSHYLRLVNTQARPVHGSMALVFAGVRTATKYLKGLWLVRRHSLA